MKAYSLLSHTSIFFVGFARCLRVAISSLVHTAPKKTNFVASFCGIYSLVSYYGTFSMHLFIGGKHTLSKDAIETVCENCPGSILRTCITKSVPLFVAEVVIFTLPHTCCGSSA